ncbi:cache domain-containing protein [Duganella hordei]|uniref:cache domain-containing protein n=1 Tax=Duganella hordei TaxID=2865934 RepID=UPI0030E91BA9
MTGIFKRLLSLTIALGLLAAAPATFAQGKGNADDATALVKKAVAFYKKYGREKALAEFSDPKGQFIDRDLYIFVIDQKAKMLAHGTLPKIIGKDVIEMKDADGNFLFKNMLELVNSKGSGWVHYKWPNPITKNIEAKSTYLEKVDDLVIGCGIYK